MPQQLNILALHDDDVICLIAAAAYENNSTPPFENNSTPPLHLIVAQRGGQSQGNSHIQSLHWGFVHVEIDGNGNTSSKIVTYNGNHL